MRDDDGGGAFGPECGCACAAGNAFGARAAERGMRRYRTSGPDRTTRWLIDGLAADGAAVGRSVLDIGAGVGAVHLELLAAGASGAVDVDGSPAYQAVARDEAGRRGVGDRVSYRVGDFVELAAEIEPADLVALDRVVCCYPDMRALVRLSAERARVRYGLVYPREAAWIRAASILFNALARLTRRQFRTWAHPTAEIDAIVRAAGFVPLARRTTPFWQVVVYERA